MVTACATVSEASELTEDNHENVIVTIVRLEWDRKHDIRDAYETRGNIPRYLPVFGDLSFLLEATEPGAIKS